MRIRLIDFDEHPLVVIVDRNGLTTVGGTGLCGLVAADVLRQLADQMEADHPATTCNPHTDTPTGPEQPVVPVTVFGSVLDRPRGLWVDGHGHTWDLTLVWVDAAGDRWAWTGSLDRGVPMLYPLAGGAPEPLDTLRIVHGPIGPMRGDV